MSKARRPRQVSKGRARKAAIDSDRGSTPPAPSRVTKESRAGSELSRIHLSADGMLEEPPTLGTARLGGKTETDSRTLAQLAASVMSAAQVEEAEPLDVGSGQPEETEEARQTQTKGGSGQSKRRRKVGFALALMLLAGIGLVWLSASGGSATSDDHGQGQSLAELGNSSPPDNGSAPPAPGDAASPADGGEISAVAVPTEQPVAVPTEQPVAVPDPGPPLSPPLPQDPGPVPAPAATPDPAPPPPISPAPMPAPTAAPLPSPTVHIGDLDGRSRRGRVFVDIWVHDSSHNPVEGATISIAWEGAVGPASCLTGPGGSCTVRTKNVSSPATVTLIVTGVSAPAGPYDSTSNHDPDGDSNGTYLTVAI